MKKGKILTRDKKLLLINGISFVFGTFCLALCYNIFLKPNNYVVGGMSGLAIILEHCFHINATLFIYASSIILIFVCYFLLGIDDTKNTFIGSLLYPLFITFTEPIAKFIVPYLNFSEVLIVVVLASLLHGFSSGLIYKYGYNTGGMDVIVKIGTKYLHISDGKSTLAFNIIVIIISAFVFGVNNATYAAIILIISSTVVDKICMGISDNKKFLIYTRETEKIKIIISEFSAGYTVFPTVEGYSHKNGTIIMCVIRNRDFTAFKERIVEIDPSAFFVISDCYEVEGGIRKSNLPFM